MVIYSPKFNMNFKNFGMDINILDERSDKIAQNLNIDFFADDLPKVLREDLLGAHDKDYIDRLYSQKRDIEIYNAYELKKYQSDQLNENFDEFFKKILQQIAGTYLACELALKHQFAFFLGGGMHHAHYDHGSGFCLLNDIVIAIRKLQANKKADHTWVVDVDAHKADGTAEICHQDETIKTFSIHMKNAWPLDVRANSIKSDIDIELEDSQNYLEHLKEGLNLIEDKRKNIDLALVVLGADPYERDELESTSSFKLNLEQMLKRDLMIYNFFKKRKIPQAYVMGGGYGVHSYKVYQQFLKAIL